MPEIPDLEGYRSYFNRRLPGHRVEAVELLIPWIVRAPREEVESRVGGNTLEEARRFGKYLGFPFESGDWLMVHAMLTGRFDYCEPKKRRRSTTAFALVLSNGMELRYFDERRMGRAYLARWEEFPEKVPRWNEMGPDVMSAELTPDAFLRRLKGYRGQIKSVLTNERCVAGLGNAYSDEVLWEARIHPYRKRIELSDEELIRVHGAIADVMAWAIPIVRERMEKDGLPANHYRDHLRVHRKGGQPCPRCGTTVSQITAGQRETNFCRTCQE